MRFFFIYVLSRCRSEFRHWKFTCIFHTVIRFPSVPLWRGHLMCTRTVPKICPFPLRSPLGSACRQCGPAGVVSPDLPPAVPLRADPRGETRKHTPPQHDMWDRASRSGVSSPPRESAALSLATIAVYAGVSAHFDASICMYFVNYWFENQKHTALFLGGIDGIVRWGIRGFVWGVAFSNNAFVMEIVRICFQIQQTNFTQAFGT